MNNNDNGGFGAMIILFIILLLLLGGCDGCKRKSKSSEPINAGYHSDYWYDREHAKEKAKQRWESREYDVRNGKKVPRTTNNN